MAYNILYWLTFWKYNTIMRLFVRIGNIQGLDNLLNINGPLILASNHRGRLDGIWIWYYIAKMNRRYPVDIRIVTGEIFFKIPILGWYLRQMRCFPVEQGRGVEVLKPMVEVLSQGKIVTIFPEGKMQKQPHHRSNAKRGVGYLVWKSKAPVLPIYINYIKRYKYLPIWEMTLIIGKPHIYNIKSENELKEYADKILDSVYQLVGK
ncbi:1-acyl-sn-glycerol-3-phosphate acyltransferase [bacterium]|nr:1-acyl-sn-glycerol-3-phosphate acyltransferase [Candidatus Elulimicrobium humile]